MASLHDVLLVVQVGVTLALLLCLWDLGRRRTVGPGQQAEGGRKG